MVLLDIISPIGFQSQTLGVCLSSACPKGWVCLTWATKNSSRGSSIFVRPLCQWVAAVGVRVFGKSASLSFLLVSMWPFYPSLWSSHSASSQVLSRRKCSICGYRCFMSTGRSEFRSFLCCHLKLHPQHRNLGGTQTHSP